MTVTVDPFFVAVCLLIMAIAVITIVWDFQKFSRREDAKRRHPAGRHARVEDGPTC